LYIENNRSITSYSLRIAIASDNPVRRSHRNIAMTFGTEKLEWSGYPMVKKLTIRLLVLTEFTNVTNGHTDGRTDTAWRHRPRLHSIARQKSELLLYFSSLLLPAIGLSLKLQHDETKYKPRTEQCTAHIHKRNCLHKVCDGCRSFQFCTNIVKLQLL